MVCLVFGRVNVLGPILCFISLYHHTFSYDFNTYHISHKAQKSILCTHILKFVWFFLSFSFRPIQYICIDCSLKFFKERDDKNEEKFLILLLTAATARKLFEKKKNVNNVIGSRVFSSNFSKLKWILFWLLVAVRWLQFYIFERLIGVVNVSDQLKICIKNYWRKFVCSWN